MQLYGQSVILPKALDFEHIFCMGPGSNNSSVTYHGKDKTVNYAAIWTTLIDTTSIESSDVSKFHSNLILVKVLEYCHDVKSQLVNSPVVNCT